MFKSKLFFVSILLCFIFPLSVFSQAQSASPEVLRNVQESFAQLDASDNFGSNLNQVDMNNLPMGIKKTVGNMDITLAVNSVDESKDYIILGVYLRIIIPEQKKTLFFGGKNIKLSHNGDIVGDAKVVLLGDFDIPMSNGNAILRLLGNFNEDTGRSNDLTFATIDCSGFKELGISAEVQISLDLCQPVDNNGKVIPNQKVAGTFKTRITNWNDIMVQVSLPPFMINGLDDFIWAVKEATFDYSDLQTPQGIFPEKYRQYLIPGQENLWKGVYIKELTITLPPQFSKKGDKRTSFDAKNMLIDDNGITGTFGVNGELLSLGDGNASGWAFSVERFALTLLANNLEGAEFAGKIGLPVSEKTTLRYEGLIGADNKYILQVQPVDSLSFDFLGATAQLDPNSYVLFKVENKRFKPEAMLHGRMGIAVKLKQEDEKEITQLKGVEFRSLHLKTEKPYLSVEYFGYKGEVKLMNFPLSVSDIALTANNTRVSLGFNAQLTLGDVFTGKTRLEIVGNMSDGELHRWKYDHVDISTIKVDAKIAETFSLKGELEILRQDPVYGDGFRGELDMGFDKVLNGLNVKMRGMFGRTDFQYWFVDGMAQIPGVGITVFPPAFNLTGFGGGVTYRMRPDLSRSSSGSLSSTSITYVPDANTSLGIKASAMFNLAKDQVVQGEATFELSFNKSGGLSYAGFYGYAKFAGEIPGAEKFQNMVGDKYASILKKEQEFTNDNPEVAEKLKQLKQYKPNEAANEMTDKNKVQGENGIMATVGMQFNFAESSFHANFELYVSMLGGFMRGVGQNNRAGYAVMHISPQEWYVHMGTPSDRIGLKMGIGSISVETGSYLMVGTNIPEAPEVPQQVASLLGTTPANLNYMSGLNSLGAGKGFAFGANLSISTGDLTFLILYANYSMGMGFDVMLKDYGEAQCKGHSGAIGMNGWYANGQAYTYMHGELGVKVNLWFMKAKLPIITADVAALMQAMLPNPSSFKAYLTANASLLGGLVNVNCRFKISIGEECELVISGSSPLEMAMINDLSPSNGASEITVFTAPQATFNMAMEKSFDVQDDEGKKTFRIKLKSFALNDGADLKGELRWNREKDAVSFFSHEILTPQKEITATVKVVFEEWKNGRWNPVFTSGKEAEEIKTVRFTTSDAPKDIPAGNVLYAYPVIDQKYYLKNEATKGYIQLQHGQTYLFPTDLKNQVWYEDERGNRKTADFTYNESKKRIEYTIPAVNNKAAYTIRIVSLSKGDNLAGGTAPTAANSLLADNNVGSIDIANKQAAAETRTDVGKTLLSYGFASSAFNTFSEKMNAVRKKDAVVVKLSSDVLAFRYETEDMEPFDIADLAGTDRTENKPLIQVNATLEDYLYREKVYPLLYKEYPVAGRFSVTRNDVEEIGVPPAKAVPVVSTYLTKVENNDFTGIAKYLFPYTYDLPRYYKSDFVDLQSQVVNSLISQGGETYRKFASATFPFISAGQYGIDLQYVMPGNVKGTKAKFEYRNFIE